MKIKHINKNKIYDVRIHYSFRSGYRYYIKEQDGKFVRVGKNIIKELGLTFSPTLSYNQPENDYHYIKLFNEAVE